MLLVSKKAATFQPFQSPAGFGLLLVSRQRRTPLADPFFFIFHLFLLLVYCQFARLIAENQTKE